MDEKFARLRKYNLWGNCTLESGFWRGNYTDKLRAYCNNRLVKVVVGQRRSGKSYILRQVALSLVRDGVSPNNIFIVNRELIDFDFLKTYQDLNELFRWYIKEQNPIGRIYIFIDEVQLIDGWEKFVNSYSQDYSRDYELFVSGSNSKMLSGELATLLSGRYVTMEVFPYSFNEYIGVTGKEFSRQAYIDYLGDSGLPEMFHLTNEEIKRNYIAALRNTVLLRDIINRHSIKDSYLLEDIFAYLVNNASNIVSISNIVNYMKSQGRKTSFDTIAAYIGYICDTFILHKAERYDIKGKDVLNGNCKYYINDLAFSNYLYNGFAYGIGYKLENLIYLDLCRAGYMVYVGAMRNREIDFVAIKGDRKIYVQVAYMLIDQETIQREYSALEVVDDNFEKFVVSLDDIALPLREGIKHVPAWMFEKIIA